MTRTCDASSCAVPPATHSQHAPRRSADLGRITGKSRLDLARLSCGRVARDDLHAVRGSLQPHKVGQTDHKLVELLGDADEILPRYSRDTAEMCAAEVIGASLYARSREISWRDTHLGDVSRRTKERHMVATAPS